MGPEQHLTLFDPVQGLEASAILRGTRGKAAVCEILEVRPTEALPRFALVLIQSFAKGEKVDRVAKEATALGATDLVVVDTVRTVVQLDDDAVPQRRERWQRLMVESARQCGRGNIPVIHGPQSLDALMHSELALPAERLLLSPSCETTLFSHLKNLPPCGVAIFIGPEGGVSSSEEESLVAFGFRPVRFGDFVLRTETAATAVLGAVRSFQQQ
jgi:16S rRNA (uracil1498-N3)-methyltransferase